MADNEAFEATLDEWRKKATPAHLAVYATRDLPDDSIAKWKPYHHHLFINKVLTEAVTDPKRRFVNLEVSVRHGKSMLTTLYLVVWFLGMYPDKRVAIITHSGDFAKQWGEATRDLFKVVGPDLFGLRVSESSSSKTLWNIDGRKGGVIALGRGAAIEGQGIDLAVLDDLLDQQAADSPTEMRKAWEWYQEGLRPRMMPGSTVVMVMSRWRVDDPAGRIEEQMRENPDGDRWETIHLPAIAECPKDEDPDTWTDVIGRKDGEALWPEVWPVDDLLQIKASVDPMVWESRFQQNPSPREGGMFKVDNWMRRPSAPEGLTKVRCWDLAATKGGGDWTVGVLMGRDTEDRFFVLDVQRFRMDGNEVKKQVLATARADGKGVTIRIEQERAGAGKAVIADYRRMLVGYNLIGAKPEGTKEQRAMPYAAQQQDGNIYLVNSIGWEKDFIEEHRTFPRGRHDDQCLVGDTLVQTAAGPKRLDAVRVGDSVLGATGWVDVEWAGMTSPSAPTVQVGPLTGTPTHPVWTGRGWVGLSDLRQDDTMLQWHAVQSRDAVPRSRRGDGAVATTGHGGDAATLSPSKPPDSTRRAECAAVAGRSCATCATGTTPSGAGMEIPSTEGQSTGRCVSMKSYSTASASAGTRTQTNPTTGATTPPGGRTSLGVLSHSTARSGSSTTAPSRTEPLSTTLTRTHSTTTSTTLPSWMEENMPPTTSRASVRTPSVLTSNPSAISLPHGTARMRVVSGIENTHADRGSAPVFNLRTSDGTFFANGILVHNCDAASGAFDELTQLQPASIEWDGEMSTENVVDYLTSANPYFANA